MAVSSNIMKHLSLLFTFLLLHTLVCAQEPDVHLVRYPFVRYHLNQIHIPGDSAAYLRLTEKLNTQFETHAGQINIVQIGGSHVQADIWTSRMRENLNRFFVQPESSRGIIFPYKAIKTNGALQYDVSYNKHWEGLRNVRLLQPDRIGLMGWKATARDSGQYIDITLKGDTVSRFVFNRLRIFHEAGDSIFSFTLSIQDSTYYPVYHDTCYCSEFSFPDLHNQFRITVHKTDTAQQEFVLHGIQTILDQPSVTYHSIGVNGASVGSYLNCMLFENQLAFLQPDLIIFSIGINDSFGKDFTQSAFEASYSELIRRIKTTCPNATLLFVTNTDSYKKYRKKFYKNPKGKEVQSAMFNLAREHGGAVWDLFEVMGGFGSIATWKRNGLASRDLIHLSRKGYLLTGDLMFDALIQSLRNPATQP
jgi:lysophospholipase L1-like esterase